MNTDPTEEADHTGASGRPPMSPAVLGLASVAAVVGVVLLVLVLLKVGWLLHLDHTVADALQPFTAAHPAYRAALVAWTLAFQPWVFRVLVGAIALSVVLLRRDPPYGVRLLAALVVGGVVDAALKAGVGRARPEWAQPVALAGGGSFPSGHALTSALGCTLLLALLLPRLRSRPARITAVAVAVAVPSATGFSRLGLGVHWLSDVVAGWCLGVAIGIAALVWTVPGTGRWTARGSDEEN